MLSAIDPKKAKKTHPSPSDKDNPRKIRRSERLVELFATSYMFRTVLFVALDGHILARWIFSADVTRGGG